MTPAERFNYGEEWDVERRRLWVSGIVRQELAYGENLLLSRRYETKIGSNSFKITDVVRNDGYNTSPLQILYHFNVEFPIQDSTSELICSVAEDVEDPRPTKWTRYEAIRAHGRAPCRYHRNSMRPTFPLPISAASMASPRPGDELGLRTRGVSLNETS